MHSLTIIIVNWNGGELLQRCLQTVRESNTTFPVKVIVVDNDSSDGSREAAQVAFPEFTIINSGANLGFGRANNLARDLVDTSHVLFLNPDTELRPDTLQKTVQCLLDHPDVGALGCKMRYPDGRVQEQGLQWQPSPGTVFLEMLFVTRDTFRRFRRWLPLFDPNQSTYIRKLYGGFVLGPREVLDRAGWFDDRYFMYAEDVDLSRTITDLGWKLYYTAEAEITHVAGGTSAKAPSGFSILMKNESINKYMRKYYGLYGSLMHRVALFIGALVRVCVLLPQGVLARLSGSRERIGRWSGSWFKNNLVLLWSLGRKSPVVAGSQRPRSESVSLGAASVPIRAAGE